MAELKSTTANGSLRIDGTLLDSSGDAGTSGQVLSSTATGTNWINSGGADNSISEYAQYVGTGANADVHVAETEINWMSTSPAFSSGTWANNGIRITVPTTGIYLVTTNWYLLGTGRRPTIRIRLAVNGTGISEFCRNTYIRVSESHNNSSANMQTLLSLTASDNISVMSFGDAGDSTPVVNLLKTQSSISVVRLA
jgi:hypothetical protein